MAAIDRLGAGRDKPLIGVTLDAEEAGGWSKFPWVALRRNYLDAIAAAGGVPVALGHIPSLVPHMLDAVDGLLVTGGAFDIDPALYGGGPAHETVALKAGRTEAELALLRGALDRSMPVFGVCGGMQLLAVALGGTLIQHLPDELDGSIAHEQPNPRDQPGHAVSIAPDTALRVIVGQDTMRVNSSHHQAVRDPGPLTVSARAPDGIVEAVELANGNRFCIGVQWHPEFMIDGGDRRLFESFVRSARG